METSPLTNSDPSLRASVESAVKLLKDLEFSREFCNERCALTLLSLADLSSSMKWSDASAPLLTTLQIMDSIKTKWGKEYKPNTREAIRRLALHQFVECGLVEQNKDCVTRPTNSPKWNYCLAQDFLDLIRSVGDAAYPEKLKDFNSRRKTWRAKQQDPRHLIKVPVTLPNNTVQHLSPGGQSKLIKAIIEEFCPRFIPSAHILFIGDTNKAEGTVNPEMLKSLSLEIKERGKEPDLIVWDPIRKWVFLIEACSSHGPVDVMRKAELEHLFGTRKDLIFVTCFPNRDVMRKYLGTLAWETECWCADTPDHMIHLNGNRFLGPYTGD